LTRSHIFALRQHQAKVAILRRIPPNWYHDWPHNCTGLSPSTYRCQNFMARYLAGRRNRQNYTPKKIACRPVSKKGRSIVYDLAPIIRVAQALARILSHSWRHDAIVDKELNELKRCIGHGEWSQLPRKEWNEIPGSYGTASVARGLFLFMIKSEYEL
jgi:hypothetical protein